MGHPFDMPIWLSVGKLVAEFNSPYDITRTIGYPGIWPLWLGMAYWVTATMFSANNYVYTLILKLPIIATDFTIPVLLSALIRQIRPNTTLNSAAISRLSRSFLLNPFVILVGAVWGMPDNMIAAALILALLKLPKPRLSGAFLALSVLVKPYPLIMLPPLLRHLKSKSWQFLLPLILLVVMGSIGPLLFLRGNPGRLFEVLASQTIRLPNAISPSAVLNNLNALYPQLITPQLIGDWVVLPLPIRYLWLEAFVALTILLLVVPRPRTKVEVIAWVRIFAISYYLLFPAVSEQTLLPLVILAMIDADTVGGLRLRSTYWSLSAVLTAFIALNVPLWKFVYPIIEISVSGPLWNLTQAWGLIALHILYTVLLLRDLRSNWRTVHQRAFMHTSDSH